MASDSETRERLARSGMGRCALEERLAELLAATKASDLDMSAFYTPDDLTRMLACDPRTLERRREQMRPPVWIAMGRSIRYPVRFFWVWVIDEIALRFGSFLTSTREPPERS